MVHCSVCGFPIMPNGCPHTILKLTSEQWSEKVHKAAKQNVQADLLTCPQCEGELHKGYCQNCKAAFESASH